jgi:hypothetical protein
MRVSALVPLSGCSIGPLIPFQRSKMRRVAGRAQKAGSGAPKGVFTGPAAAVPSVQRLGSERITDNGVAKQDRR